MYLHKQACVQLGVCHVVGATTCPSPGACTCPCAGPGTHTATCTTVCAYVNAHGDRVHTDSACCAIGCGGGSLSTPGFAIAAVRVVHCHQVRRAAVPGVGCLDANSVLASGGRGSSRCRGRRCTWWCACYRAIPWDRQVVRGRDSINRHCYVVDDGASYA